MHRHCRGGYGTLGGMLVRSDAIGGMITDDTRLIDKQFYEWWRLRGVHGPSLRVTRFRNGNLVVSMVNTNSFTPHACLTASHMDEHRTMYFSTSTTLSDERALLAILQQSRRDNAAAGISGILLYVRGSIVQVLEGEAQAVEMLFRRIEVDKRHTNVVRVLDQPITQRLFADWAMGYETITHRQMEEIRATVILDEHHNAMITIEPNEHIILRLIKVFYETSRHN